jgi:hypothetical protein
MNLPVTCLDYCTHAPGSRRFPTVVLLLVVRPAILQAVCRAKHDRALACPAALLPVSPDGTACEAAEPWSHTRRLFVGTQGIRVKQATRHVDRKLPEVIERALSDVLRGYLGVG